MALASSSFCEWMGKVVTLSRLSLCVWLLPQNCDSSTLSSASSMISSIESSLGSLNISTLCAHTPTSQHHIHYHSIMCSMCAAVWLPKCFRLHHTVWGWARVWEGVRATELPGGSGASVDHSGSGKVTYFEEKGHTKGTIVPLCCISQWTLCVSIIIRPLSALSTLAGGKGCFMKQKRLYQR